MNVTVRSRKSARRASPSPDVWLKDAVMRRDQPLPQQVYALLRRVIVEGRLEPGVALNEPAITRHLNISRTPVREALLRLQRDGLIELRPQSGTFVAPIDTTRVEEGMIVREALEARVAAITAERITDRVLADLETETELMAAAAERGDGRAFIEADDRFHRLLVDASGYAHIAVIIDQVNAQLDRIRYLSVTVPERPEASVNEHREIIGRLRRGDADGSAAALRQHLNNSWQIIRNVLAGLD